MVYNGVDKNLKEKRQNEQSYENAIKFEKV